MLGTESWDLHASMSIENGKEEDLFTDSIEYHGVLHIFSQSLVMVIFTLHLRGDDSDFTMLIDVGIFGSDGLW